MLSAIIVPPLLVTKLPLFEFVPPPWISKVPLATLTMPLLLNVVEIVEVAALPRVTVQVVPFRQGGHAGAGGSFTVLRFGQPDLPDVAYIEQLTSALYLERRTDVDHYLEVMNRLSAEALTPVGTIRFVKEIIRDT